MNVEMLYASLDAAKAAHIDDHRAARWGDASRSAEEMRKAQAALAALGVCQAERFGEDRCECTDTKPYYAGAYGMGTLCPSHSYLAAHAADEADAAMREQASALGQMLSDERRMMR